MDTLSHALWGGGLFGYRKYRWVAIFFGVIPDLLSFGVLFLIKFVSGELNYSGLPTLESLLQLRPIPEWVFIMDNFTHSFVTSFLFVAIVYFLKPQLVWPILAWPFSYSSRFRVSYKRPISSSIILAYYRLLC